MWMLLRVRRVLLSHVHHHGPVSACYSKRNSDQHHWYAYNGAYHREAK
jgi:hypothetical protein